MTAESHLTLNNTKYSDRQIRLNNVDPDQNAPSSMIRVFCLHLFCPLPYGRTTLLEVYDYYSSFWGVQNFLGSLRYFYRSSLKSLHLKYFDLYTIMILMFSNSQVWPSIVDPVQTASESTLFVIQFASITLMAKPYCSDFKIITGIVQVPKIFGFAVN